jgi:hypothetical protein
MFDEVMIVSRKQPFAVCTECLEKINDALIKWGGENGLGGSDEFKIIYK